MGALELYIAGKQTNNSWHGMSTELLPEYQSQSNRPLERATEEL